MGTSPSTLANDATITKWPNVFNAGQGCFDGQIEHFASTDSRAGVGTSQPSKKQKLATLTDLYFAKLSAVARCFLSTGTVSWANLAVWASPDLACASFLATPFL